MSQGFRGSSSSLYSTSVLEEHMSLLVRLDPCERALQAWQTRRVRPEYFARHPLPPASCRRPAKTTSTPGPSRPSLLHEHRDDRQTLYGCAPRLEPRADRADALLLSRRRQRGQRLRLSVSPRSSKTWRLENHLNLTLARMLRDVAHLEAHTR